MVDVSQNTNPISGNDNSVEFAPSLPSTAEGRVMPVIVQPVVPETTGAIASQAIASIPRPSEGTIRVIATAGLAELNFNFPPSSVHIAALDVDLVMVFSDNSKLILPNLAMGLLGSNPPKLSFLGKSVSPQDVVGAINQVTLADASPSIHLASNDFLPKKPKGPTAGDQENATGHDGIGGGEPPVPPQPIVSGGKFDRQSQETQTKTGDFNTPPVKEVPAGSLSISSSNGAVSNPSVVQAPQKNIDSPDTKGAFAFDSVVTGQLFQTVGTSSANNQVKGSTGTGNADSNPDFAAQNAKEILTGSDQGDEIWGEDPETYSAGMAGRSLQITLPVTSVVASKVVISGVPDSVKILNATYIGGGRYEMLITGGNTVRMKLAYQLPSNDIAVDSDGYYHGYKYTFSFDFTGTNTKGEKGTVTASATVGIRDVGSAADQIGIDPETGKLIVGLSRDPTGNIVNAGDGDDTVHGAAGADIIDGGSGPRDRVVYDLSNDGVSVNLATGQGDLGFARGDTYTNIEDVFGSDYADTLIGDANNNLLSGGKGNDSLVGGAGSNTLVGGAGADTLDGTGGAFDVADYSASTTGVTVDLGAGTGGGGDATGDVLRNIEAVVGSAQADYLIAAASGSSLFGGDGNDTLDAGATQNSTLDGGLGSNTLDYGRASAGVSASLTGGQDARGNQFSRFSNLGGSNYDDTLAGDAGNDTLVGGGGADSLFGGAGNDLLRLDWSSINYRLDGGAGTDTINLGGTSNATLSGSSFSNLLSNAEFLDFSGTSGAVSLSLGGDDIQKILTGSSSSSSYAGLLDVKFDSSGDSLSLLSNGSYSYWNSSDVNATSGQIANGTNYSITNGTNSYVYVFDNNHTTLLATLYFHT